MLITCVILMMIDVIMHGQGRVSHLVFVLGCCFGDGGSTFLVYDYLELYGANAQKYLK